MTGQLGWNNFLCWRTQHIWDVVCKWCCIAKSHRLDKLIWIRYRLNRNMRHFIIRYGPNLLVAVYGPSRLPHSFRDRQLSWLGKQEISDTNHLATRILLVHIRLTMYYTSLLFYDIINVSLRFSHGFSTNCFDAVKSDGHHYRSHCNHYI